MVRRLQRTVPITEFLLVHHEPAECRFIAEHLHERTGAAVKSVSTMSEGTRLIESRRFDLALIEVVVPEMAGVQLAELAANQNIPVLLLSDGSTSTEHIRRLGFPVLERPFEIDLLVAQSISIVQKTGMIIDEVAASTDKMNSVMRSLTEEVAEANRLFDLIMARLGRKKSD